MLDENALFYIGLLHTTIALLVSYRVVYVRWKRPTFGLELEGGYIDDDRTHEHSEIDQSPACLGTSSQQCPCLDTRSASVLPLKREPFLEFSVQTAAEDKTNEKIKSHCYFPSLKKLFYNNEVDVFEVQCTAHVFSCASTCKGYGASRQYSSKPKNNFAVKVATNPPRGRCLLVNDSLLCISMASRTGWDLSKTGVVDLQLPEDVDWIESNNEFIIAETPQSLAVLDVRKLSLAPGVDDSGATQFTQPRLRWKSFALPRSEGRGYERAILRRRLALITTRRDVYVVDVEAVAMVRRIHADADIFSATISETARRVIVSLDKEPLQLQTFVYDLDTGMIVSQYYGHTTRVYSMDVTENHLALVATSGFEYNDVCDRDIHVWNSSNGLGLYKIPSPSIILEFDYTANGRGLILCYEESIELVDLVHGHRHRMMALIASTKHTLPTDVLKLVFLFLI